MASQPIQGKTHFIQLLEKAFDNMQLGITLTDLEGKILYTNAAEAQMHGYKIEELIGKDARIFAPRDLWKTLKSEEVRDIRSWKRESINVREDGTVFPVQIISDILTNPDGTPLGMVTVSEDISERKSSVAAFYDPLTALPSRQLALDRLNRSVKRIKRKPDYLFAVLVMDLDLFRKINEQFGTTIGDQLLSACARRIESCLRFGDTVARLGGDEFFILLEDLRGVNDATFISERILQHVAIPFTLDGQEVLITGSIGIVQGGTGYDRPEDILHDADTAMFRAKAMGRDRYQVFDRSMQTRALAVLPLESALRNAIEQSELQIAYQPVYSLETDKIECCDTVLTWNHPQRGTVFYEEFFPVAEESGLINLIENWTIQKVLKSVLGWKQAHRNFSAGIRMAENQLRRKNLVESIHKILLEYGIEPQVLQLEFSERHLQSNADVASRHLEELKQLGVLLTLCDFGTGQSSLISMQRFHIDYLKMDRSFLRDMVLDARNESTAAAVITLAHSLNMKVIADGVETDEQLAFLKWHHCDLAQGRLLGEAIPGDQFGNLLM